MGFCILEADFFSDGLIYKDFIRVYLNRAPQGTSQLITYQPMSQGHLRHKTQVDTDHGSCLCAEMTLVSSGRLSTQEWNQQGCTSTSDGGRQLLSGNFILPQFTSHTDIGIHPPSPSLRTAPHKDPVSQEQARVPFQLLFEIGTMVIMSPYAQSKAKQKEKGKGMENVLAVFPV